MIAYSESNILLLYYVTININDPPLSTRDADNVGVNIDLSLLTVHVLGFSSTIGSVNYVTTNKYNRHIGLTLMNINIYNFSIIVTSILLIGSLPILGVAITGLLLDRNINSTIYDVIGDPVLYQHIFWFFGQNGPIHIMNMHHAICWKALEYITIIISKLSKLYFHNSDNILFIKSQSAGNQRRYIVSLVGTSETTRMKSSYIQWLAGLIDGDGCLLVSQKGYTSLEITMELSDKAALYSIKDKYGGSIKLRSGSNAYRYRLHHREGMIKLINDVNGNIRNSKRLAQLHKVCIILNIPVIYPIPLNKDNSWFTGFFDADGCITISIKYNNPQLSIRVSNKYIQDIQCFQDIFGGNIYYDNSSNGSYQWSIQSRNDILSFYQYLKINPSRSHKIHRIHLINKYYQLKDLKSYQNNIHVWNLFLDKWNNNNNH